MFIPHRQDSPPCAEGLRLRQKAGVEANPSANLWPPSALCKMHADANSSLCTEMRWISRAIVPPLRVVGEEVESSMAFYSPGRAPAAVGHRRGHGSCRGAQAAACSALTSITSHKKVSTSSLSQPFLILLHGPFRLIPASERSDFSPCPYQIQKANLEINGEENKRD